MQFPQEDMLKLQFALGAASQLKVQLEANRKRVEELYPWTQSADVEKLNGFIHSSDTLSPELRDLASLTKINYIPVIANYLTDSMSVAGISREGKNYSEAWTQWQKQDMANKEKWIYKNAFSYAESIVIVSKNPDGTVRTQVTNPSKISGFKFDYNDAAPTYAMVQINAEENLYDIYDSTYVYRVKLAGFTPNTPPVLINITSHGFNTIPVVSYLNDFDWVREISIGEVAPYINAQKLIFKSLWDTQATSHSQGFKVRYITGLELPEEEVDEHGNAITDRAKKYMQEVRMDSLIVTPNSDASIGTLPETPIDGLLKNIEANIEHLATISNTPFFVLRQQVANISTDTANVMTQSTRNKLRDRKQRFGSSHRRLISLMMEAIGETVAAEDISITWAATDTTQIGAYTDALGKQATMLHIPYRALWPKLTDIGWTPEQLRYAEELDDEAQRQDAIFAQTVISSTDDMANAGLPEPEEDEEF